MKKQLVIIGIIALLVCVGLSGCTNNEPYPKNPRITVNIENNYDGQISGTIRIWGPDFNYNREFTMDKNMKNSFVFNVTREQLGVIDDINVSVEAGGGKDYHWLTGASYYGNWYRNYTVYGSGSSIDIKLEEKWGLYPG